MTTNDDELTTYRSTGGGSYELVDVKQPSSYRKALDRWAAKYVPGGAQVVSVATAYDDGWVTVNSLVSVFAGRPERVDVIISYYHPILPNELLYSELSMETMTGIGELLTELFAIEETS